MQATKAVQHVKQCLKIDIYIKQMCLMVLSAADHLQMPGQDPFK